MTDLSHIAAAVRYRLVQMSHDAQAGHLGSQLSCVDILVALYFGVLRIDPKNPTDPDRDIFIMSKGHAIAAQYVVLAMRGFFEEAELATYGKPGSRLPEQPEPNNIPGLECATGSLGHGLGIGVGMALAAKIKGSPRRVFVLLGDGELNEGSVWEAAQMAHACLLDNLVVVVDVNGLQGIGETWRMTGGLEPAFKWQAFGWDVRFMNGHDIESLRLLFGPNNEGPRAIMARTTKGKGVSLLENTVESHYRIPTAAEVEMARKELQP